MCLFEILDPRNLQNKTKFIALAFLHPDIFKNVTFSIFWRSGGVKMTSFGVIWRHRSSLWLHWIMCDIYLGKVTKGFWDIPIFHKTAIENVRLGVEKYPHEHYECKFHSLHTLFPNLYLPTSRLTLFLKGLKLCPLVTPTSRTKYLPGSK